MTPAKMRDAVLSWIHGRGGKPGYYCIKNRAHLIIEDDMIDKTNY